MPVLRKSELHTKGPSPKSMIRLLKISTMISGHVSDIGPPMVESYRWDHHACEHKSVCVCVWVACIYAPGPATPPLPPPPMGWVPYTGPI